jgi:hypothetical protein
MNLLRRLFRRGFGFPAHLRGVKPVDSSGLVADRVHLPTPKEMPSLCPECHSVLGPDCHPRWCSKWTMPEYVCTASDVANGRCL